MKWLIWLHMVLLEKDCNKYLGPPIAWHVLIYISFLKIPKAGNDGGYSKDILIFWLKILYNNICSNICISTFLLSTLTNSILYLFFYRWIIRLSLFCIFLNTRFHYPLSYWQTDRQEHVAKMLLSSHIFL